MPLSSFDFRAIPLILCSLSSLPLGAQAQIIPDQTLGPEASELITDQLVRGDMADLIEGGATRGGNLFHSFSEFNVNNGQRVYFANPAEITSILSRITGNNISEIFGTLGVDGSADLFLINPNGLIFGENAQLDIEGSFYGTTAETVEVGTEVFSAVAPEQSQLLAVSPSVSFWNYLTENSGDIVNRGQLAIGGDLVLAGETLDLQGQVTAAGNVSLLATDTVQIRDTPDVPFITLAGEELLIQGNQQVDIVALSHPDSGLFSYGDMVLRSAERVGGDAHYLSGGDFRVEQLDGNGGELFSPIDPIIRAFGNVEIEGYIGNSLHIIAGGSVTLGTVLITALDPGQLGIDFLQEEIALSDGTVLDINGNAQPTLDVRAGVSPDAIAIQEVTGVDFPDFFFSPPALTDASTESNIVVGTFGTLPPDGLVFLTNQYQPNPTLSDGDIIVRQGGGAIGIGGDGGAVVLDSKGNILLQENAVLGAYSDMGDGGMIWLSASEDIILKEGASINAFSGPDIGQGVNTSRGGDITLIAGSSIQLAGSDSLLTAADIVTSGGGNIQIMGENLLMQQFSFIRADTIGSQGDGSILIETDDSVLINGGNIGALVFLGSTANGADITINTKDFLLVGAREPDNLLVNGFSTGGDITTETLSIGDAGNIDVTANEISILRGAQIRASSGAEVYPFGGKGGNINVSATESLEIRGSLPPTFFSRITSDTYSASPSGDVVVVVENGDLIIQETGVISSQVRSSSSGTGGNTIVSANNILLQSGGQINAGTFGPGDGGQLTVTALEAVTVIGASGTSPSGLFTATFGLGDANLLTIDAEQLFVLEGGQVSSSTLGLSEGQGGNINIIASETLEIVGKSSDSSLFSSVSSGSGTLLGIIFDDATVNSGNLNIVTSNLTIQDGGSISTESLGRGDAGSIDIQFDELLQSKDGNITARSTFAGGGTIKIWGGNLQLFGDSDIRSDVANGADNAGSITLIGDSVLAFDDSDILAFAADGRGGNIILDTPAFLGENFIPGSLPPFDNNDRVDINATGNLASGNVSLPDVSFIADSLTELPDNLVNPEALVASSCIARSDDTSSGFTITGSDSLPQQPSSSQSTYSLSGVQSITDEEFHNNLSVTEPHSVYRLADGRLIMSQECEK